MGAFVISKRFNDEYKFVFTSRKGKVIFTSLSYELKFEGEEDIEKFKANIDQAKFLKFKGSGGKYFFKLMLGEVHFATSRKYTTELLLQKGIKEIVMYGARSEILDFSSSELIFEDEEEEVEVGEEVED
jgi:uncharacterized protein YegP (UPF0339 family)